jgi:hypothetical protein
MFTVNKAKPSLMNVKVAKDDIGSLRTTPTNAIMRISKLGAEILGFQPDEYICIVPVTQEDGTESFAVCAGKEGDDNNPTVGSKLAAPSKTANGTLGFSAAHAYNQLGGNATTSTIYRINPEFADYTDENGVTTRYWELVKHETVPVTPRKKSEGATAEDEEEEDDAALVGANQTNA